MTNIADGQLAFSGSYETGLHPTLMSITITSDESLPRGAAMTAAFADAAEDTLARLQRRSRGSTLS